MAGIDDILKALPIDQIAAKLGVDPDTAKAAVEQGGDAILTGLQRNAETPEGSAAIEAALSRHAADGPVDIDSIDTADGEKILGHVFGGDEQQVAQRLTDSPQTAGIDFGTLLPALAPLVMGLLAKKQGSQAPAGAGSSGGIGDVIGGLLGGGGSSQSGGGVDLGGLLGGLFGGKN